MAETRRLWKEQSEALQSENADLKYRIEVHADKEARALRARDMAQQDLRLAIRSARDRQEDFARVQLQKVFLEEKAKVRPLSCLVGSGVLFPRLALVLQSTSIQVVRLLLDFRLVWYPTPPRCRAACFESVPRAFDFGKPDKARVPVSYRIAFCLVCTYVR